MINHIFTTGVWSNQPLTTGQCSHREPETVPSVWDTHTIMGKKMHSSLNRMENSFSCEKAGHILQKQKNLPHLFN